jgi:hypothetical protein
MGAKKRRRNGGRVNKRKNLNDNREKYHNSTPFANDVVRRGWDRNKTVKQNYATLGLLGGNLNQLPRRDRDTNNELPENSAALPLGSDSIVPKKPVEFMSGWQLEALREGESMASIDARPAGASIRGSHYMTELEIAYIEPLFAKYGDNYQKMWKDSQNYKQETRLKLQRRCERYVEYLKICEEEEKKQKMEREEMEEEEEEDNDSSDDE